MREFDQKMHRAFKRLALKPGDIYESCSYHPVLCLGVDYKQDEIWGISLIDGTYPMSCSLVHCGVRKLTPKQAWQVKLHGPSDPDARKGIASSKQWWQPKVGEVPYRVALSGPRAARPAVARKKVSK